MFRSISVITMRKKQYKTVFDVPFCLTRCDHGVNHDLGTVGKISKLGLPQAKCVRVGLSITVLKSEDGILAQM